MNKTRTVILVMALAGSPLAAGADSGFSYSFFSASSAEGDFAAAIGHEQRDQDGDRREIAAGFEVGKEFFVSLGSARYTGHGETQFQHVDTEENRHALGVGYHRSITPAVDAVFSIHLVTAEAESLTVRSMTFGSEYHEESDTGWNITAGLRGRVLDRGEWFASVAKPRVMHDSSPSLEGGLRFWISPHFAFEANYLRESRFKGTAIGVRIEL